MSKCEIISLIIDLPIVLLWFSMLFKYIHKTVKNFGEQPSNDYNRLRLYGLFLFGPWINLGVIIFITGITEKVVELIIN